MEIPRKGLIYGAQLSNATDWRVEETKWQRKTLKRKQNEQVKWDRKGSTAAPYSGL